MSAAGALRCHALNGAGGAVICPLPEAGQAPPGAPAVWYRFTSKDPGLAATIETAVGLDRITAASLLAEETRPRCTRHGDGALIILRAVNFNPGEEPEDMISFRMWIDPLRIVSVQGERVLAADRVVEALAQGQGPANPGDFLVMLADELTEGMQQAVEEVDTDVDRLEEALGHEPVHLLRAQVTGLRRTVAALRRFIAPQRDAFDVLIVEPFSWQTETHERRLKEVVDRITRLVEQLDEIQIRAAVLQESLTGEVAERLNRTMAALSIVAGVFLPLSFVAGLLGMNVRGIPGADSPWAFAVVLVVMVLIAAVAVWLFKQYRLM